MTRMLKKAFDEASQVPDRVQDTIAALVLAKLQSSEPEEPMRQLVARGLTDRIIRNRPSSYRRLKPLLSHTTAQQLIDEERADR